MVVVSAGAVVVGSSAAASRTIFVVVSPPPELRAAPVAAPMPSTTAAAAVPMAMRPARVISIPEFWHESDTKGNPMSKYRKTIAAVVTGLIGWATMVVASDSSSITSTEWIALATVLATALGVYGVTNATD